MQHTEKGAGRLKGFLALAFIAAVIYCGVKIIPVYVENYQLQDYVRGLAVDATVAYPPATVDGVTQDVLNKAHHLGLPITADEVQVAVGHTVSIQIDYTVPIDLQVFSFSLHFTPSATNSNLT